MRNCDQAVTSMACVLNQPVDMRAVRERIAVQFAEMFGVKLVEMTREELEARLREVEKGTQTSAD